MDMNISQKDNSDKGYGDSFKTTCDIGDSRAPLPGNNMFTRKVFLLLVPYMVTVCSLGVGLKGQIKCGSRHPTTTRLNKEMRCMGEIGLQ